MLLDNERNKKYTISPYTFHYILLLLIHTRRPNTLMKSEGEKEKRKNRQKNNN